MALFAVALLCASCNRPGEQAATDHVTTASARTEPAPTASVAAPTIPSIDPDEGDKETVVSFSYTRCGK